MFRLLVLFISLTSILSAQVASVSDDFEGNGTIENWFGDDCDFKVGQDNPFSQGINSSDKVLEYHDVGGQWANVRFDIGGNLDLSTGSIFTLKIYVTSTGLSGNQPNQISLKLQNGLINEAWSTQSEIIKPVILDQWQTVSFDFANDNYINLDDNSGPPIARTDFNRVVIQLNGENNNDEVLAYLDEVVYDGTVSIPVDPVYDYLVWSDEFDENGPIDQSKWFAQTKLPQNGSWFNGEIQHYTDQVENASVENGILRLKAIKETFTDQGQTKQYTSARLNSKFAFTYGKIEVRAKLPSGVGTWPAIWTLGKNIQESGAYWQTQGYGTISWPACGEIDIMEHWGDNQNFVQSALHTPSSFGGTINKGGQNIPTASTEFHTYSVTWTPERMIFSVDDVVHYTYQPSDLNSDTWPFDKDQYILLNIAIQPSISPSFTESSMDIDYVRVYQESLVSTFDTKEYNSLYTYPVPFTDQLTIEVDDTSDGQIEVNVYAIDGSLVTMIPQVINEGQIYFDNLSYLNSGLYFMTFDLEGKPYSVKVIKN